MQLLSVNVGAPDAFAVKSGQSRINWPPVAGPAVTMAEIMAGHPFPDPSADFVAPGAGSPIQTKLRAHLLETSGSP